ncbi:pathogenesis-related protein STH-21-like [Punica granatum]|uniref:Bet v I/Major latex protein domain-containing protein n=2 Tax=Punica granatum TaxID=22663 RepID=A0A218W4Z9_PUNGR|nr:pathogenesis-related protein STH-21-like [Punica granatum]OWM67380.1 hypothetical protein CDL15_Pgr000832 [Punica granatum]PKI43078.1 hypothetical protein CRG98_036557 [Punica granatum]
MAVTCFTQEFSISIAPSRMFSPEPQTPTTSSPRLPLRVLRALDLLREMAVLESIKQTNFASGGHLQWLKHRIDAIDTEKLICNYTRIESDITFDKIEPVVYEVKFEALGDRGCLCKMTSEYHVKASVELKEEDIKQGKDKAMGLYKVVQECLLASPEAYA